MGAFIVKLARVECHLPDSKSAVPICSAFEYPADFDGGWRGERGRPGRAGWAPFYRFRAGRSRGAGVAPTFLGQRKGG